MITAIFCSLVVGVLVGILFGVILMSRDTDSCPHWDYEIKSGKLSSCETRLMLLERENDRINHIFDNMNKRRQSFCDTYYAHCRYCETTFTSRDQKDKEVAEMLSSITLNSGEIAKKLGLEIK